MYNKAQRKDKKIISLVPLLLMARKKVVRFDATSQTTFFIKS